MSLSGLSQPTAFRTRPATLHFGKIHYADDLKELPAMHTLMQNINSHPLVHALDVARVDLRISRGSLF